MPYVTRLDKELKIFYQLIYGHCLFSDLFKVAFEPEFHPDNRPRVNIIIDNQNGDLEGDQEGMKMFIKFITDLEKTGFEMEPTAIVTTQKSLAIFVQALEILVDDVSEVRQVFPSLDKAIAWLGEAENTQAIHKLRDELLEEAQTKYGRIF